jgi:Ca-activated chloride channel homolog
MAAAGIRVRRVIFSAIVVTTIAGCGLLLALPHSAAFAAPTANPHPQTEQKQPPIQVRVSLVNISFVARDANGKLIDNLTKDDVQVFEDGAPQALRYFARAGDVPLTLGLILDISGSQDPFEKTHQNDLGIFLNEVLGVNDRAFLIAFGNHIRLVSDFTNSGTELLDQLNEFQKAKSKEMKKYVEVGPLQDRDLGTAFYDSIFYSVTEKLAKENGRRAILMFSDGEDNSSSHDMMTTIEEAQAEDVSVYTIRYTEIHHGKLNARNEYGVRVMDRIAKETGALAIDARETDPHVYFKQIGDELRNVYEVGYYPANAERDGTFRKIVIKAKQPGITIRAKTGYSAR